MKKNVYTMTKTILKKHKKIIALKFFASFIVRISLFVVPIMYSIAINKIPLKDYSIAIQFLIGALILTTVYYFSSSWNDYIYYKLYSELYKEYSWEIIQSTHANSTYSLSRFRLAEYSNIFNSDLAIVVDFIDTGIIRILKMIEFIVIFGYFFFLSKLIFIISILVFLFVIGIGLLSGKKIEKYNLRRKNTLDSYLSTINNTFLGMREIKSLHILDRIKAQVSESTYQYLHENKQYNVFSKWSTYLILGIVELVRYGFIIYGVYLISTGQFELGTIVLIYNYYQKMVDNLNEFCTLNVEYRNFKISMKRIDKVFEYSRVAKEHMVQNIDFLSREIVFENVLYGDRLDPILNQVSFTIKPHILTMITGKIGSGKSGIFDLLTRMNKQHEGKITIGSIDIGIMEENLYYNLVASARKHPIFFDMSILDNLKLVTIDEDKIKSICKVLKIDSLIQSLPQGYETSIYNREVNTELKHMLGITRVLVKNSEIMLFDEILDTLDDDNQKLVLSYLQKLKKDHTIVVISRASEILDAADSTITMERNSIKNIDEKR